MKVKLRQNSHPRPVGLIPDRPAARFAAPPHERPPGRVTISVTAAQTLARLRSLAQRGDLTLLLGAKGPVVRELLASHDLPEPDGFVGGSPWWRASSLLDWLDGAGHDAR